MSRDMSIEMQVALEQPVIRPVLIAYLDILNDPIAMWTGVGNFAPNGSDDEVLNGKVFQSDKSFADMSDVSEDNGIGGPLTIILKANSLNEDALRQIVRDKRRWRSRKAYIWLGLLNEELNAVLEYPVRIKTGIIASVTVTRGVDNVSIEMIVDEDLQDASTAAFKITDHQQIVEGDTFASFVSKLANQPKGLETNSMNTASGRQAMMDRLKNAGPFNL